MSVPPSDRSCSLQGIFHFQLGRGEPMLHTRLRPHCKEFLEKVARLYELHVFTFGSRLYAHTIAGERLMGFCPALDTQRPACGFGSSLSQRRILQMEGRSEALPASALAPRWWLGCGQAVLQSLLSARRQSRSSPECKPLSLCQLHAAGHWRGWSGSRPRGEVGALCEGCRPGHQGRVCLS